MQCTFPDECSGQRCLTLKSKLWGFMGISRAAVIPQPLCLTLRLTQGFYSPWNSLLLFNQLCSGRRVGEGIIWFSRISGDEQMQVQLSWNRDLCYTDGGLYSRGGSQRKFGTVWRFSGEKMLFEGPPVCSCSVACIMVETQNLESTMWTRLVDVVW